MIYFISFLSLLSLFCIYMFVRNIFIYNFYNKIFKKSLELYDKLPSYEYMFFHFWVWPLDRFLPKEGQRD